MILSYWLLHHIVETRWIYLINTNTCNGISYWKHKNRYITNREYPKSAIYVWGANYDCHANVYEMANLIRALKQWVFLNEHIIINHYIDFCNQFVRQVSSDIRKRDINKKLLFVQEVIPNSVSSQTHTADWPFCNPLLIRTQMMWLFIIIAAIFSRTHQMTTLNDHIEIERW